jgi:hypothetical protein
MLTVAGKPELDKRLEHDPERPLSKQQLRAVELLVAGELTTQAVADALGMSRHHLWRWRSLPAFQAEYRRRLALAEQEAMDLAISRRVNRVAALNETWQALREEIAAKGPRPDLVYALIAASTAAAKELGQWHERVSLRGQLEVAERVRVIRFVAQEPHPQRDAIDTRFSEAEPRPVPDSAFARALRESGIPSEPRRAEPEEAAAIRDALAPEQARTVLTPAQFAAVYPEHEE